MDQQLTPEVKCGDLSMPLLFCLLKSQVKAMRFHFNSSKIAKHSKIIKQSVFSIYRFHVHKFNKQWTENIWGKHCICTKHAKAFSLVIIL
jgi:hypothetical protein